jgi:crotonobetainyl-CoA:carnitine CoA-transferase CaiB-like acyl-CoA transferase
LGARSVGIADESGLEDVAGGVALPVLLLVAVAGAGLVAAAGVVDESAADFPAGSAAVDEVGGLLLVAGSVDAVCAYTKPSAPTRVVAAAVAVRVLMTFMRASSCSDEGLVRGRGANADANRLWVP